MINTESFDVNSVWKRQEYVLDINFKQLFLFFGKFHEVFRNLFESLLKTEMKSFLMKSSENNSFCEINTSLVTICLIPSMLSLAKFADITANAFGSKINGILFGRIKV